MTAFGIGIWLLVWVLLGAAVLVGHLALGWAVFRAERASGWDRLGGLVPGLATIVGWRLGLRFWPVLWWALVIAYLVLRAAR